MKIRIASILVLLSTFILGGLLNRAYYRWNVQFKANGVGSMGRCDSGLGGFSTFDSYDGEKLTFSRNRFPSELEAQECFEKTTTDGLNISEREPLYDEAGGKRVGERIVATTKSEYDHESEVSLIIALDADYIVEIGSTSLRHALIFEERARKY